MIARILLSSTLLGAVALSGFAQTREMPRTTIENFTISWFVDAGASGSEILEGNCQRSDVGLFDFPSFHNGEDALNYLTVVQPHLSWSQGKGGLLQIVDDRANGALLNLRLNKAEVRDVIVLSDAVDALLSAPEIRSYLHREHIQLEDVISSSYFWDKSPEQQSLRAALNPKYSVTFSNVTVREALNTLLLEFPGVWIYSECPGQVSVVAYSTRIPKLWRGFRTGAVKDQSPHP